MCECVHVFVCSSSSLLSVFVCMPRQPSVHGFSLCVSGIRPLSWLSSCVCVCACFSTAVSLL